MLCIILVLFVSRSYTLIWEGFFDPSTWFGSKPTIAEAAADGDVPSTIILMLYSITERIILHLYSKFLPYSSWVCSLGYSMFSFITDRKNVLIFNIARVIYFSIRVAISYSVDIRKNKEASREGFSRGNGK